MDIAKTIIRVFPRRTSMTPTDAYAFIGDPPLWRPKADEVHVSVAFTWDIGEGYRLRDAWAHYYDVVRIGGPAIEECDRVGEFVPGRYVRHGITFTTRGCPNRCGWCLVPHSEGKLKTLEIKPGWIVQDNNLLAAPREHLHRVFNMLRHQYRRVTFSGGLDSRLIDDCVVDELQSLKVKEIFLACDTLAAVEPLREAVRRLDFLDRRQLRCFVLLAHAGEQIDQAEARLRQVWEIGCLPFAQLYQPPKYYIDYDHDWKALARTWSRPAAMFALMKPN